MDNMWLQLDAILADKSNTLIGGDELLVGDDVRLIIKGVTNENLKIALKILDLAQTYVPVDTGYLKSRGRIIEESGGYAVIYDADYAKYVHENTGVKHLNGRSHFLIDAYTEVMTKGYGR